MSMNRTDYLMIGVDIKNKNIDFCDEENYEKFSSYTEGHCNCEFRIVEDYMSGRYCFFGKVLKKAEEYDGFDREPIDLNESNTNELKMCVKNEYFKLFNENIELDNIKLYLFSNWM